jgi:hypothetical protein
MNNSLFIELKRIGYGSNFNKLSIDYNNNIIKKECINEYGLKKINYEKEFYEYILKNNKNNDIFPTIINFFDNGYSMKFLNNYTPLYKFIYDFDDNKKILIINNIIKSINKIHIIDKLYLSNELFFQNINIEIYNKNITRYNLIKDVINKYSYIKKINGLFFTSYEEVLKILNKKIINLLIKKYNNDYYFTPIHGDIQFNNILYNIDKNDYYFIDPRGYFGNYSIYGLKEYDIAKIYFALSGYDEFDNRDITYLDINDDNINIRINYIDKDIFDINKYDELSILLMLNIWLGNSQCFMDNNEFKGIYSYFISLYLFSKYIKI